MRCVNLKGDHCGFVVLSDVLARLPTHWSGSATLICPGAVGDRCPMCEYHRPRVLGYAACMMLGPAELQVREIFLVEMPESLADFLDSNSGDGVRGLAVTASRSSKRRPWVVDKLTRANVVTEVDRSELFESIGRLYRLPATLGTVGSTFKQRFGRAVVNRMVRECTIADSA